MRWSEADFQSQLVVLEFLETQARQEIVRTVLYMYTAPGQEQDEHRNTTVIRRQKHDSTSS